MRRQLSGTFRAQAIGEGAWRLSRGGPSPAQLFLRGADSAAAVFGALEVQDIGMEWRPEAVKLLLTSAGHEVCATVQSAIVHEPLPRLYEALPLVTLDAAAKRFWRGIFRLVRIPGGRHLLAVLARRRAGRA